MPDLAAARASHLRNIEQASGRTMADFAAAVATRGIASHARVIAFLRTEYGRSYGNANAVALHVREQAAGGPVADDALLDAQYAGPKAALRPVYERLRDLATGLGPDVDVVVQKTGVALRRRRQFGLVQAASAKRVTLGLNLLGDPANPRIIATPGAMCAYRVDLGGADEVDDEVAGWLAAAYERAG